MSRIDINMIKKCLRVKIECITQQDIQFSTSHKETMRTRYKTDSLFLDLALHYIYALIVILGAKCSSVVRPFAHGARCRRIDPSWRSH